MESTKIKPLDVLSESQLSEIRKKNDLRNIYALLFDWGANDPRSLCFL